MPQGIAERTPARWPPKVWLIMSYRTGESSQILALGESLGWPYEIKQLDYRHSGFATNLLRRVSLAGIVKSKSSPLQPPWPDLIISAGLRNEPVCRWVHRHAGGKIRLVYIGRPWARLEHFDLIITTPQYRLPARPNVLQNALTLHRVTESRLVEAAAHWSPRLFHLPKPRIAVMVGGNSGPYTFGPKAAVRLGREASALANAVGGSLLVSTSARTPRSSINTLRAAISSPAHVFEWTPDNADDNPYFGFLALAEKVIVTGDSIAMLTEACATKKPVFIFDTGGSPIPSQTRTNPPRPSWQASRTLSDFRLSSFLYQQMMRIGPRRLTRDLEIVYQKLIASGHAVWLGHDLPNDQRPPPLEDMQRAVTRVRALFEVNV